MANASRGLFTIKEKYSVIALFAVKLPAEGSIAGGRGSEAISG